MPRTILVTEGRSPLGAALVKLLAARGCSVAFTTDAPGAGAAQPGAAEPGSTEPGAPSSPLALAWNRRSPVSARTVVVSMQNAFDTFDEALVLEPSCTAAGPLSAVASADVERSFDDGKGTVFLVREVLAAFQGRGGIICFVSGPAGGGPVESAVHEAFRGLAESLLAAPGSAAIVANGFQCGVAAPEEYAAFVDRTLEEKARKITGRWFSYPARGGFLQGVFKTSSNP
jgi:NAD(P)-dependent dehydrogenase (short-subunit alcohol dehydrogenase family)